MAWQGRKSDWFISTEKGMRNSNLLCPALVL
jgi:hypothetical protein